ncbi:PAS domain S-box-containing protein [Ruminococcus sp. YRD2003]|uniref:HD domain-containing phosphohydrolase n=1 Tax=Ruminococcus sp. YRD2003 TaxID=1452313 RepID=UPI0008C49264|nr:PAS domain S-box-containing protein [Ruminococcus flavefaciens]
MESIYESIIHSMSEGVIVILFDGRIDFCNQAAASAIQRDTSQLVGRSIAELMSESEENDVFFELILDAVYSKEKVSKTVPFFTDDDLKYLHVTTALLTGTDKEKGLIIVIRDMTEEVKLFISNKRLANQVINLMDSFVEVMVTEIEERSTYNANHTKSMVRYATGYLETLRREGKLADVTNENIHPLLMSIWLHDIGKLLVPPEILDKATRLGDGLTEVLHRIETAQLMLRLKMYQEPEKQSSHEAQLRRIDEAKELILSCNSAGFLEKSSIAKLREAAGLTCLTSDGACIPLLSDDELEKLIVVRGTLTAGERKVVESHVSFTRELLSKMEFRGEYKQVPKWAAGHHELLDGSGYPDKLNADSIPWETRLLTIIDVYDALTAEDRPYKPPLPPEKAFAILRDMSAHGKVDGGILESFYQSGAWKRE